MTCRPARRGLAAAVRVGTEGDDSAGCSPAADRSPVSAISVDVLVGRGAGAGLVCASRTRPTLTRSVAQKIAVDTWIGR